MIVTLRQSINVNRGFKKRNSSYVVHDPPRVKHNSFCVPLHQNSLPNSRNTPELTSCNLFLGSKTSIWTSNSRSTPTRGRNIWIYTNSNRKTSFKWQSCQRHVKHCVHTMYTHCTHSVTHSKCHLRLVKRSLEPAKKSPRVAKKSLRITILVDPKWPEWAILAVPGGRSERSRPRQNHDFELFLTSPESPLERGVFSRIWRK